MARSEDSIGSCSLDVDSDSEMSDCSSIFLTPLSTKDLHREFTSQIQDRCPIKFNVIQNPIVTIDNLQTAYQVKAISEQSACIDSEPPEVPILSAADKKLSYLNLACCVNGYSSITTYDSEVRQNINKSREVSPIRPSTTGFHYYKNIDSLPHTFKSNMPHQNKSNVESITKPKIGRKSEVTCMDSINNKKCYENVGKLLSSTSNSSDANKKSTSFIQQRVERLYGPGALAQGFYSPKKLKSKAEETKNHIEASELRLKSKCVSPSYGFLECPALLYNSNEHNNIKLDLPVLRHLSQEFRAQLPSISLKKNYIRNSNVDDNPQSKVNGEKNQVVNDICSSIELPQQPSIDQIDYKGHQNGSIRMDNLHNKTILDEILGTNVSKNNDTDFKKETDCQMNNISHLIDPIVSIKRDGNYFLNLLKIEQDRLLALAEKSESYIAVLSENTDISEDTLGILRSASGKSRLLVSQKLKQFEGLCQNNLNHGLEEKFPTTVEDLQGFWDMVNLQIDDVNSIFKEIEFLKQNGWKEKEELSPIIVRKQQINKKTDSMKPKPIPNISDNSLRPKSLPSTSSASALKREAQRKQLQELKRKNKVAMAGSKCSNFQDPDQRKGENCS